ncbi:MAG: hypothetical protein COV35_10495 [Alphaproteobacteria bacterium CG11_big_fil_rev_8_21_14_0_20_39_49]|nr:MAG: hypothetical protein COV35_10495 [Alphaproteobacteria bacterium CG11_big_fil_rev_8_21_14_0_20_39_49]
MLRSFLILIFSVLFLLSCTPSENKFRNKAGSMLDKTGRKYVSIIFGTIEGDFSNCMIYGYDQSDINYITGKNAEPGEFVIGTRRFYPYDRAFDSIDNFFFFALQPGKVHINKLSCRISNTTYNYVIDKTFTVGNGKYVFLGNLKFNVDKKVAFLPASLQKLEKYKIQHDYNDTRPIKAIKRTFTNVTNDRIIILKNFSNNNREVYGNSKLNSVSDIDLLNKEHKKPKKSNLLESDLNKLDFNIDKFNKF